MAKLGKCPKCPPGSRDVLLFGGECYAHFSKMQDAGDRDKQPDKKSAKKAETKTLSQWFTEQEKQIPAKCENCRKKISIPAALPRRTAVAHIVPKRSVKSVKTHPVNRWFGCWQCHTDFDNLPAEKVAKMPVVIICRERLKEFIHLVPAEEMKHIPNYLL